MRETGLVRRAGAFFGRALARLVVAALLACIAAAVYLAVAGLPKPLLLKLQRRIPGRYAFEIGSARIDPFGAISMYDVRIYRKRVLGPPAVVADRITIETNLLDAWRRRPFARRVIFESADFVPAVILASVTNEPELSEESLSTSVDMEVRNSSVLGVGIEDLSLTVRWEPSGWVWEDVRARLRRNDKDGSVRGRVKYDRQRDLLEGEMTAIMDPWIVFPVMLDRGMPRTVAALQRFSFGATAPRIEARFEMRGVETNSYFRLRGQFWGENFVFDGFDALRSAGNMDIESSDENTVLRIEPLAVMRADGTVTGGFAIDYAAQTIRFDGSSTIDPKALALLTGFASEDDLSDWVFDGPVRITARGVVGIEDSALTDFKASIVGRKFGLPPVIAQEAAFDLIVTNRIAAVTNLVGKWCGGGFAGNATLTFPDSASTNALSYVCDWWLRDAAFEDVLKAIRGESGKASGDFSIRLRLSGMAGRGHGNTAVGKGMMKVRNGRVFTLPVFGGLSSILAKIVPGLDLIMRQSDLTCEFDVANGLISTDKLLVEGDVLSINARGSADLAGNLDFHARVQLMKEHTLVGKILQTLTYPIGKLFEFRVRGTLDKPRWYPVNFSKDLLDRLDLDKD